MEKILQSELIHTRGEEGKQLFRWWDGLRGKIESQYFMKMTTRIEAWHQPGTILNELGERDFQNFSFHVAMSEPQAEDNWTGPTGFIHTVVLDKYLNDHPDPTEIEFYLCGPPPMIAAVNKMLYDLGVEKEMIAYDEF